MADKASLIEKAILLKLDIKQNTPEAKKAIQDLRIQYGAFMSDLKKLEAAFGNLDKASGDIAKAYKKQAKGAKAAAGGMSTLTKSIASAASSVMKLGAVVTGAIVSLMHMSKTTVNLEKQYLKVSGGVKRLGIGFTELESKLKAVSDATKLTRTETVALFDSYQKSMRFVSLEGFESMMKNIRKVVGPNAEAMAEMGSVITGLSGKFPVLAKQMQNVTDKNRGFLLEQVRRLQLAGEIGDMEARSLQSYLRGNSQMSAADKKRAELAQERTDAMQKIKRIVEDFGLALGKVAMPILIAITDIIERIQKNTEQWEKWVMRVVAAVLVLKGAMIAVKGLSMVSGGLGALGLGGGLAAAGGTGMTAMGALPGTAATGGAMGILGTGTAAGTMAIGAAGTALIAGAVYSGFTMFNEDFANAQGESTKMHGVVNALPEWMSNFNWKGEKTVRGKIGTATESEENKKRMKALQAKGEVWDPGKKKYDNTVEGREEREKDRQKWIKSKRDPMRAKEGYKGGSDIRKAKEKEERIAKKVEGINKDIVDAQISQKQLAEALSGLYQAQSGHLATTLQHMSMTGNLSRQQIQERTKGVVDTEMKRGKALKNVQSTMEGGGRVSAEMLKASGITMKEYEDGMKRASEETDKHKATEIAKTTTAAALVKIKDEVLKTEININAAYMAGTKAHEQRLKAMSLESARASKLIEIADNYAIGVGASAQMRLDLYDAEGQKIKELRSQLKTNANAMAVAAERGYDTLELANQRKEIENDILDSTLKQNQAVKAMRDGWVSAISAMNTGAGGFSEIIMNAESNTAMVTRLPGAVASAYSGYTNRRGENKGHRRSEFFTMGGLGGRQSDRGDYMENLGIDFQRRGAMERVIEDMGAKGRMAAQGEAFGAAGSKHYPGMINTGQYRESRKDRDRGGGYGSGGSIGSGSSAPYVIKPAGANDGGAGRGSANVTVPVTLNINVENVDYIPQAIEEHVSRICENAINR